MGKLATLVSLGELAMLFRFFLRRLPCVMGPTFVRQFGTSFRQREPGHLHGLRGIPIRAVGLNCNSRALYWTGWQRISSNAYADIASSKFTPMRAVILDRSTHDPNANSRYDSQPLDRMSLLCSISLARIENIKRKTKQI
jgi:hypothetical protein